MGMLNLDAIREEYRTDDRSSMGEVLRELSFTRAKLKRCMDALDKIEALVEEWETIASEDVASYTAQAHYVGRSRELRAILEPS